MTTGLFFGSFNPIHIGHMMLANYMLEYAGIDDLWFVVSPQNPFKQKKTLLGQYQRLEMVNLAITDPVKMKASDIEFRLPVPSFTVDTLAYLTEKYPKRQFNIIMGADGIKTFNRWKNADFIIQNYKRIIYPRHGSELDQSKLENAVIIDAPLIEVSSSFIRQAIKDGKKVEFFLPPKVYQYINEMGYYK